MMMRSFIHLKENVAPGATLACLLTGLLATGCNQEPPATYSITVPTPNTIQADIQLTQRYGVALSGAFDILQYGSVYLHGETPEHPFQFGFRLNSGVFLKETWVNYQEVRALPTGDAFPSWLSGGVTDVVVPAINIPALNWHFYFGTGSQFYVGAAGVISAINQNFPSLRLEYNFYDAQSRVILGLVFFGPHVVAGQLESPGGIFVGTNISPFLPADVRANWSRDTLGSTPHPTGVAPNMPQTPDTINPGALPTALGQSDLSAGANLRSLQISPQIFALAQQATEEAFKPSRESGRSISSELRVVGPDAHRYQGRQQILGLIRQFGSAGH